MEKKEQKAYILSDTGVMLDAARAMQSMGVSPQWLRGVRLVMFILEMKFTWKTRALTQCHQLNVHKSWAKIRSACFQGSDLELVAIHFTPRFMSPLVGQC